MNLYSEKAATTRNSMTGQYLKGLATYLPIVDSLGRPLDHRGAPLRLITNRTMLMTKSRTISNYWLTAIQPENYIEINRMDARWLGLSDGDLVWVISATNPQGVWNYGPGLSKPMIGRVRTSYHIRPGVATFELGWGHWAYGATAQEIDGQLVPGDPRRGAGIHANAAMYVDPYLRSPLSD
ncbi:MAG: molybdopterin oxidoreductase, partial [Thermoleophilia bacterium]|nr:molybdopterin oxidoreductase [Thermoleophilia bacterium]